MGKNTLPGIIVLIGPKHSGKTSAGMILAELISGCFIDLDALIETRTGKSCRALYRESPEIFRKAEAGTLESVLAESGANTAMRIIAAGGGLVDNEAALALLQAHPQVLLVYLEVSPETAWERIRRTAEKEGELPPFLQTASPEETHRALHERRGADCEAVCKAVCSAVGKKAMGITIHADHKTPETIGREIAGRLEQIFNGRCLDTV